MPARHRVLPDHGQLMISTDLHGNLGDFRALVDVFHALRADREDTHWVLLGDVVHGPNSLAAREEPALYGYRDESRALVAELAALVARHPANVHLVLGNHDHGHVGGPHTRKFHDDEVHHLERGMPPAERAAMRALFEGAMLVVIAPCGLLLSHGCPGGALQRLEHLDTVELDVRRNRGAAAHVLQEVLTSYGQPDDVCAAMLARVSPPGLPLSVVVHGHDRDEKGFFVEGHHQLCPVIFGARHDEKRYVVVDLAARYGAAGDLRDGHELRRLHVARAGAR